MSETSLILRDDSLQQIQFTELAQALKDEALARGALVGRVTTPEEQGAAVEAQKVLHGLIGEIEKARQFCKEPVLRFGKDIDLKAKAYVADLKDEELRISALIGSFQALELAKVRAAQASENERLNKLERERMAEAAKATSHAQLEAVHEKFNDRARDESVSVAPARVEGQIVKQGWDFQIRNEWEFARWAMASGNTACIKIEPVTSEIKALLKAGVQIPGIKGWPTVNASVRAGHQQKAIAV